MSSRVSLYFSLLPLSFVFYLLSFYEDIWATQMILARPGAQIILLNSDWDNKIAAHLRQRKQKTQKGRRGKGLFFLRIFALFAF
jgi:hypothetical protein